MSTASLLSRTIRRMGLEDIEALLSPAVMDLIRVETNDPDKSVLAEIAISIFGEYGILSDGVKRTLVIQNMDPNSVKVLAESLPNYSNEFNPWDFATEFAFRGSVCKKITLNHFEVCEPAQHSLKDTKVKPKPFELIEAEYPLFQHQERAAREVITVLENHQRVLLHMPTGAGKTRTAMNILAEYLRADTISDDKSVLVWMADTEELCQQAMDEFKKAWSVLGSRTLKVFSLFGASGPELDKIDEGVLIASPQMLSSRFSVDQAGKLRLANRVSLVIFDEAHKATAPTYSHILENFLTLGKSKLIGLSATPGRSTLDDLENQKFAAFFDHQKVSLRVEGYDSPIDYLQEEGYLAKVDFQQLPYKNEDLILTEKDMKSLAVSADFPEYILKKLGVDGKRNIVILNAVMEELNKSSKIILFACSVSHAESLYAILQYKGQRSGLVSSKTERQVRKDTISAYKDGEIDILINYGVLTTGFDAPKTNVAIVARPTQSLSLYSQMIGRATRGPRAGGNEECRIYTVIDSNLPAFGNLVAAFEHWDGSWN